ncbi:Carrier domain-containing protein [Bordetella flabilis]
MALRGQGEGSRLVAYIVGQADEPALRAQVSRKLPAYMAPSAYVRLDALPLMANGKLDRAALPEPTDTAVERRIVAPRSETEARLLVIWQEVLGRQDIGVTDNFFEVGGDSILSLRIIARAAQAGLGLTHRQLFDTPDIERLAHAADQHGTTGSADTPGEVRTPLPLTPIQRVFFERHPHGESHWNQSVLLKVRAAGDEERGSRTKGVDMRALRRALQLLLDRHDALRLRFGSEWDQDGTAAGGTTAGGPDRDGDAGVGASISAPDGGGMSETTFGTLGDPGAMPWRQRAEAPGTAIMLDEIDLAGDPAWRETLRQHADVLQRGLDIRCGPVVRAAYFHVGDREGRLLLIAHHLAVDGVSWRILLDELRIAYDDARAGRDTPLPPALPWTAWVTALREYASGVEVTAEWPWWRETLADARPALLAVPAGAQDGQKETQGRQTAMQRGQTGTQGDPAAMQARPTAPYTEGPQTRETPTMSPPARERRSQHVDAGLTRTLLDGAARAYRMGPDEILLAVLARAVHAATRDDDILVAVEGHGREAILPGLDLSRTVGWFTTRYPVRLRPVDALGHTLIACKETLRGVPRKGLHWGLLRAWGDAATRAEMAALPVPPIGFNYLGRFERNIDAQGRFALVGSAEGESGGRSMADDGHSPYAVDLNAMVLDGELSMDWRFDPSQYAPGLPERLVAAVDHALREIADHCATVEPTPTAADFPLARLDQRGFEALGLPTDGVQDVYPATPLQAGLLYQSLARPGEGHYVIQKRLTLAGAYDGDAMRAAWERVLAHHDVLRTRFEWRHGGGVLQIVQKEAALPYAEHDWSARDAADYDQALRAWLCDDMARGFDAAVAPLLRIAVFRRHDGACDLVWTGHHLLTDGWSSARLLGQVVACYREAAVGRVHVLPPTRPYRDYVSWLAGQPDAEGWWRDRLAKVDDPATLRQAGLCDAQSGAVNGMGEWVQCLDGVRGEALAHAARRHRVTLNTLVQGAWALLLGRCGHRRQAAFGITVSGRPPELPGMEEMLGLFINTLPLWVDLPPDMPLSRWLSSLQDANAALRQYEYTDLARLQKWAGVHGDADALFDSLVVFENYPVDPALRARTGPLALRDYGVEERTHYPLVLTASHDGQLRLHWKWDRRRIADGTAQGLARRYLDLLQRLAADGDPCLGALGLVPETEAMARAARQPAQEPATLSGAPDTEPLHRQIARQARLRPQAVALTLDGLAMTYGELDRRANRLAHRLIAQGAGPECRIGLAAPRSMALVVGMLGILKAGAAYVPLDPDYPHERLAYLIEDSGIDVLVAHPAARGSLPALSVPLVTLAPDPASLAPGNAEPKNEGAKNRDAMSADAKTGAGNKDAKIEDAEIEDAENEDPDDDARLDRDPAVPVHPDNLAYVIYTSGSTGQPKGAQLSHRNVSRLLSRTQAWFDFRSDDVWTLFHSYAFDFSVWEIFGALCHGGRLVIVPQPVSRDPAAFLALLQGERVTILNQTPSAFRPLIDAAMAASAPALDLRAVVFGGEALDPQILRPWFDRYGDARPQLVNMYGITETTVHVTYRPIVAADAARHGSPLGQPIPDLGMYVLDRDGNAAAPGIAGELYIGGAGLARGYLNRPGLTAERFVPNPHGPAGSRLYRTGDLARLQEGGGATRPRMDDAEDPVAGAPRADDVADDLQYDVQGDVRGDVPCDVHYVGRIDGQVKIRGFRIELGEVEARLRACDGVADAVAVARAQHGAMRVVAYACPPTGHTLDAGSLRDAMARQCPAHMVPAAIVVLPALPLTPNGKVDRRALPEPEFRAADDAPPMGPVEHTLAEVWQEVLGLPRVGRHDNFFALGGDSILSLQVLARASKRGLRATPRQLFEAPTIAGLTQRIADDEGPPADGAEVSTPTRTGAAGEAAMAAPGFDAASLTPRQWAQLGVDRNAIQDLYPATPLQHGMLFHNLLQDGQGVYIDQNGFRLSGALDAGALQAAWSLAVARHDILRTAFVWPPGAHAMQVVMREAVLPFQEHDWRHKSADDYEVDLETWRRKDLATAFALSRPPLLRVAVFSGPDGRHDVISTNHHVLLDGWSYAQLVGEVMAAYRAGRRNEAPSLPPPGRFRAYVDWLGRQAPPRAWWQARHAEAGEPATLGSSVLPPAAEGLYDSEHLHHLVHELDEAATIRLEQAARRYRVTVNTLVQGAWAMLLGRYASRDHAAFGITVSGRPTELPEIENVLGLFINSLPLWVDVRAGQRVGPWLAALQQRNSDARAHGHASVSQLQQWTGLSGEALFDSLIVFENYPVDRSLREGDHGLTLERLRVTERTHYPMVMVVVPVARMRFRFKFDSTRLRDAVARRLTAGFLHILDGLAGADADSVLGVIAMDRHAAPGRPRADHPFVPAARRIRARAASQPGAPALHCEGQALRYGELQQWADAIAAQLRGAGVGAEHRVGLCVRRSVALPAALLGVWNAGAAFVPLDPDYPAERLAQMMDDARVGVVLADAHTAARLGSLLGDRQVVDVASCAPPGGSAEAGAAVEDVNADRKGQNHQSQQSDQNEQPVQRDPAVHPDQLAYVIYTSGSTGTPKGVAVSQRALSLHLDDFIQTYRIGAGDIQLQLSTINFDVFLHELLPALIQGGQVRMRGPQAWDLRTTSRELAEGHVTFSRIPTAYWQQWLREPPPAQALRALRQITVGGEALPGDALRQWRSGPLGHIDLDNLYGPTETTVACMARRTGQADTAQAIVCIGQPYPSRSVYVMDGEGNEVPVGALGELCIGGDTLARGYLNRPGLTAEKFIPDPYRADGARLYRSGDLCRRREDGAIDFLGRIDQQVKLRGFRIEPGEIEAVLRQVPQVEEALVALRGQGEGSRLVAYIVGQADEPALRAQVARKLPAHMAPSAYVRLDALPLMANGKLDRAALPEPEGVVAERQAVAPRSETEARLLAIWQEVLARQDIGVTDNFFEVGGDSIAALRVIESARVAGMEGQSLDRLFRHPTIRALSDRTDEDAFPGNIVPLGGTRAAPRLFAIHPGYGRVESYRALARRLEPDIAVYGVQSPVYTEDDWWPASLQDLVRDYADRIQAVQPRGPYLLLGWSIGGAIAARVAQALEARGHAVDFLGLVDSHARPGFEDRVQSSQADAIPGPGTGGARRPRIDPAEAEALLAQWRAQPAMRDALAAAGPRVHVQAVHALLARTSYEALRGWHTPYPLRARAHLWLAGQSLAGSAEDAVRAWQALTATEVRMAGRVAAHHEDIVTAAAFLESAAAALAQALAPARSADGANGASSAPFDLATR